MASRRDDGLIARVSRQIAETRRWAGLTQEALAARLGIATKNLQRIESGRQNLTLATVERIAVVLGVEPSAFFLRESPKLSASPGPVMRDRLEEAGFDVRARGTRRSPRSVPILANAAVGDPTGGTRGASIVGWVSLLDAVRGSFVARVSGRHMEPRIAHDSICLFRPVLGKALTKRVLLLEHHSLPISDPLVGHVMLSEVATVERSRGRTVVVLESANRDVEAIRLELDHPNDLRVIGELQRVLVTGGKRRT